ncbi:3-oxoacyl-ACP reductase FabG [Dyella sp. LX-66]|uniref:3-oxoacyl-ACP reductase family protein n=1 Tax=unclassified Dyella TaxID=2634549 RepID=UPI001BE08BBD|nr:MULTISPECIES: 3-oxoacyl-ACP reductase family protein [unclassified Dyella]MBT2116581.1 3-oxoacyl-ACP reductase FabG [Dyella sp. LX-1]MBT2140476.1 3-oxoacyl-ACP reductase FabG [Dyella sp. LX-66]
MSTLNGKVALVTGGSRGIGAATVQRLARDGAAVAFTYVSSPDKAQALVREIEAAGGKARAYQADAADPAALRATVDQAAADFGRLDILVNNAGIFLGGVFEETTLEDYERTMAVNVRAVFVASQAAARHLGEGGRIISIGSCLADSVPSPGMTLYSMSKSALSAFTKGLARDLGARGITVNLVQPGSTNTDMNPADGEHAEHQRMRMAIPRYGDASNIAGMVAWLASEEGRFATGAAFTVDGGANA